MSVGPSPALALSAAEATKTLHRALETYQSPGLLDHMEGPATLIA